MAEQDEVTNVQEPGPGELPDPKVDPVMGLQPRPNDVPGTENGVLAELGGTTQYVGYFRPGDVRKANKMKNAGLQANMPPWTLVDFSELGRVWFRIVHFEVQLIRSLQTREFDEVRMQMSWRKGVELPPWGRIEANARTVLHSLVECTSGSMVDLDGARRASELRNAGILYAFPSQIMEGVRIRLLHLAHPWLAVVRYDAEKHLREAMGLGGDADLPSEVETEVERYMLLASMVGCEAGIAKCAKPNGNLYDVDLSEFTREELRLWFVQECMPAAKLEGKVPPEREHQIPYFTRMFAEHNPDIIRAFRIAHNAIRTTVNEDLLIWGSDYVAGADWERLERETKTYEPDRGKFVNLQAMDRGTLIKTLRQNLFPVVNFMQRPPSSGPGREDYFRSLYLPFNNGALEEFLNRESEIREVDHDVLLGKGDDYVAGLSESTASTE